MSVVGTVLVFAALAVIGYVIYEGIKRQKAKPPADSSHLPRPPPGGPEDKDR